LKEISLGKLFKLDALGKRDVFWGGNKILPQTMFPQGEGDYVDLGSNFP
jgi:hypothetical protein